MASFITPKMSNSLMSGSLPIAADNALFIADAIIVPSIEATGPAARTAGVSPIFGAFQTTIFFAPAASSSVSIVLMSPTYAAVVDWMIPLMQAGLPPQPPAASRACRALSPPPSTT